MSRLTVYLNNRVAGYFSKEPGDRIRFSYTQEWYESWQKLAAHKISVQLPVSRPDVKLDATAFVAGLLPDSARHRTLIAHEIGLGEDVSDFAFLSKIGRDSAGALVVTPEAESSLRTRPGVRWLDESGIADHLRSLPQRPLLIDDDQGVVLSLAGVNDKAAVVYRDGKIGLPQNGQPSTHIIKVDIPSLKDSVITEQFSLNIAKGVGFRVPRSQILQVEDQTFMLMQRYDRKICEAKLVRVHQEDFCQALNIMPGMKYERFGGPGWAECFQLMSETINPTTSRATLLDMAIFQFLSGNPDAHAKNYSLLYKTTSDQCELAPIYDLNNAAAFKSMFKKAKPIMAMFIGGEIDRDAVDIENWKRFAKDVSISYNLVAQRIASMSDQIIEALPAADEGLPESEAVQIAHQDIYDRCVAWKDFGKSPTDTPSP